MTRLTYETLRRPLAEAWSTHKGTAHEIVQILVRLESEGRTGFGTAVFAKELQQTAETVPAALDRCARMVSAHSPYEIERILDRLEAALPSQSAAIAAVDLALHDLLGKVVGLPLYRLWGLEGLPLPPTGRSIGRQPEAKLVERARQLAAWPVVKLKVASPAEAASIGKVRAVYPGRLWVDGNGCFTPEQALEVAAQLADHGVELFEQPIPAGTPERLGDLRRRSPIAIAADEDCVGPEDLFRLRDQVDVVVIKLVKCGGLRRAAEMVRLARRLGLKVMLGSKSESVIGVTAMAQLGGLADHLDLDGHLGVLDDAFDGIAVEEGRVTLPSAPGLGVVPRRSA